MKTSKQLLEEQRRREYDLRRAVLHVQGVWPKLNAAEKLLIEAEAAFKQANRPDLQTKTLYTEIRKLKTQLSELEKKLPKF